MIKCTINKEINGVNFKVLYMTQPCNLYSFFSIPNRNYFYVIVNLENKSILKESRELSNLPEFGIDSLMHEYNFKQNQFSMSNLAQEVSPY